MSLHVESTSNRGFLVVGSQTFHRFLPCVCTMNISWRSLWIELDWCSASEFLLDLCPLIYALVLIGTKKVFIMICSKMATFWKINAALLMTKVSTARVNDRYSGLSRRFNFRYSLRSKLAECSFSWKNMVYGLSYTFWSFNAPTTVFKSSSLVTKPLLSTFEVDGAWSAKRGRVRRNTGSFCHDLDRNESVLIEILSTKQMEYALEWEIKWTESV